MSNITLLALVMDNNVACVNNTIPTTLEAHLEKIREKIYDKSVLMGHTTYEQLGSNPFSLCNETWVLTRNNIRCKENVIAMHSIVEVMAQEKDFIVLGGISTFSDFIPVCSTILLTEVLETATGDKFKLFPRLNSFKLTNPNTEILEEDGKYYRFMEYVRK